VHSDFFCPECDVSWFLRNIRCLSAKTDGITSKKPIISLHRIYKCFGSQRSWLRHYATSRKVTSSRSDEVNELFSIYLILSAALGSAFAQPLTEMSTRSRNTCFWGVERGRCVRLIVQTKWNPQHLNPIGLNGLLRG
jgi:hypothetical protein